MSPIGSEHDIWRHEPTYSIDRLPFQPVQVHTWYRTYVRATSQGLEFQSAAV